MARIGDTARTSLKSILEAVLMASDEPLNMNMLAAVFAEDERPSNAEIGSALVVGSGVFALFRSGHASN